MKIMSIRPSDAVEGASRFSLRSMFAGFSSEEDQNQSSTEQVKTNRAAQNPVYTHQNVGVNKPVVMSAVASGANGSIHQLPVHTAGSIRFSLPNIKDTQTTQAPSNTMSVSNKSLSAGFLSGGTGASQGELLRLQGAVEDLTARLKKTTEKLAATEQSVMAGNRSLKKERQLTHARIIALQSEVKKASEREAAVRLELAAIPKASELDAEKFRIQSEGAVQLEAQYQKEKEMRVKAEQMLEETGTNYSQLEATLAEREAERDAMKATYDALQLSHTSACEKLENALAENASKNSKNIEEGIEAQDARVASLQKEVEELRSKLQLQELNPDSDFQQERDLLEAKLGEADQKLTDAVRNATAAQVEFERKELESTRLIEELDSKLANAREEIRQANATRDALRNVESITKKIDELEVSMTAGCGCSEPTLPFVTEGTQKRDEDNTNSEEDKAAGDQGKKENDSDDSADSTEPSSSKLSIEPEHQLMWDQYHAARMEAEKAADTAQEFPEDHELVAAASRKRMLAMRRHRALFGFSTKPSVRFVVKNEEHCDACAGCNISDIICDKDEIRKSMHASINATLGQFGIASIAVDEADVELTGVPISGKRRRQIIKGASAQEIARQDRTTSLIQALTADLKTNFTDLNDQWTAALSMKSSSATGAARLNA